MNIEDYISQKKKVEDEIIRLLEQSERNEKLDFTTISDYINDQKIQEDENEFRQFVHLIVSISKSFHRFSNFYDVIIQIFEMVKDLFPKYLTNKETYDILKSDKRLILYFIENQILHIDAIIVHQMLKMPKTTANYFFNEIKEYIVAEKGENFLNQIQQENSIYNKEDFELNRKSGQNELYICQLIRDDSIKDFIIYVNQTNLSLRKTKIKQSIFESSIFLLNNEPTLIEYAAFYGSIQIFKYLQLNGVELTQSLWTYAIYGKNYDIIHLLEENHIEPIKSYSSLCRIAIECHHNELAQYFLVNYMNENELEKFWLTSYSLKYYNFNIMPEIKLNNRTVFDVCSFDYYFLLEQLAKENDFNVNFKEKNILDKNKLFLTPFQIAIFECNHNIASFLMKYPEVDINEKIEKIEKDSNEKSSYSPLEYTIWINDLKNAELLLKNEKIDVNAISEFTSEIYKNKMQIITYNPLCRAILKNNADSVKLIMSHKDTDVNMKLKKYYKYEYSDPSKTEISLLQYAIESENIEIIKLFLDNPNTDVNIASDVFTKEYLNEYEYIESALYYAIKKGNNDIIKLFLNHPKIDVNLKSMQICRYNYHETGFNKKNETILNHAIYKNNIEIIKLILNHPQIDINIKSSYKLYNKKDYDETALTLATREKKHEIVKILLKHPQIDPNIKVQSIEPKDKKEKLSALHLALLNDDKEMILILLSYKNIDINLIGTKYFDYDKYKFSPLIISIIRNQNEIFELLLSKDEIEINTQLIKTSQNKSFKEIKTPLFMAVDEANEKMIQCLLSKKEIDVNFESTFTSSFQIDKIKILFRACEMENINIIKTLLEHPSIDVNPILFSKFFKSKETTVERYVPLLHYIILLKNKKILQLLLENPKIDPNLQSITIKNTESKITKDTKDTLQVACDQKNIEIFKIIFDFLRKSNEFAFLNEYENIEDYTEIKKLVNEKIKSIES